ncbi:hypothetical protein EGW08_017705 [Elysia chlorotica]|uniref:Uncharacterized protein n=1 Tax=Elysia chlorotica TaxID=188477 RepID=A0A433SYZ6_ELYCH|nr:hypothetical protein EGW08_017705 [Elysia chlorotica]
MLNQPEQEDLFVEYLDSKEAIASAADADTTNESEKDCSRCKIRNAPGAAKRNLNHRAKVTVQRRANRNQKVVSLSFDKAVELTGAAYANILETADNVATPSVKIECENESTLDDERTLDRADCDTSRSESIGLSPTLHVSKKTNKAYEHDNSKVASAQLPSKAEAWLPETEGASISKEEGAKDESIAPPPIRLRQAWASPTLGRQKQATSVLETKATNTEAIWSKKKQLQKGTPASLFIKGGSDNAVMLGKNSSSESERSIVGPQEDQGKSFAEHKSKNKTRLGIDLNNVKSACADSFCVKNQSEEMKSDKSTLHIPTGDDANNTTFAIFGADSKSHGMGDAQLIREGNEKQNDDETGACSADTEHSSQKKRAKSKKAKKMGGALFSWSPFKKKPHQKQKNNDSKLDDSPEKAESGGSVKKTSLADVFYRQGRVDMPESITAMFAASHPEKIVAADPNHQDTR